MILSSRSLGIIEALLSATFFGLIPVLYFPIYEAGISAENFLVYRFGIASLLMLIPILLKKRSLHIPLKTHSFIAIGGFSYYIAALFLYTSFAYIASGVSVTIFYTNPIFVMLVMALVYKEKIEAYKILFSITSMFGIALFSGVLTSDSVLNFEGMSFALLASLSFPFYVLALFALRDTKVSNEVVSFYLFVFCTLFASIYSFLSGEFVVAKSSYVWLFLFLSALVTAILPNILLLAAIRKIGSVLATILGVMEPIVAVLIGVLFFGEAMNFYILSGILIVLTSVSLITIIPLLRVKIKIKNVS